VTGRLLKLAVFLILALCAGLIIPSFGFEVVIQSHSTLYPRIGTPVLTVLPNGSILSVFTVVSGNYMGIYGKLSENLRVWSEPFLIKAKTQSYQPFSCALFTTQNKSFLIYDRYVWFSDIYVDNNCSIWELESQDNGQTWTNDRRIDAGNHDYTVGLYSIFRTENGTLIYPYSWYVPYSPRWCCEMLRSDDEGLSWYEVGRVPSFLQSVNDVDEPTVVQLSNGSLYCLMRTCIVDEPRHAYSVSNDLGLSWSEVRLVPEMFSIDTTPALIRFGSEILASWINRSSLNEPRSPLVVAVSHDDCAFWQNITVLKNPNGSSMNDMSFCIVAGQVVLSYRRYDTTMNRSFMNDDAVIRVLELDSSGLHEVNLIPDFNHDGNVDILDAIILSNNFNTLTVLTDLNYDGLTNLDDVLLFAEAF
jgi:hypothetical protein